LARRGGARYYLPTTVDEYHRVYGGNRDPTATSRKDIEFAASATARLLPLKVSKQGFEGTIRAAHVSYAIVVGHNERGDFRFTDGTHAPLYELANACASAGAVCVFLSCRAARWVGSSGTGAKKDLTFQESIQIADGLISAIKMAPTRISVEDLGMQLTVIEKDVHLKYHIRYLVEIGCGVVAGAIVVAMIVSALPKDCKELRPCS
jgi:hypothetical protein